MEYKIIEAERLETLNKDINAMIAEGWRPVHRVVAVFEPPINRCKFFQSLFKGDAQWLGG